MYLWRKAADPRWLSGREERLQARARGALAIMARPAESACNWRLLASRDRKRGILSATLMARSRNSRAVGGGDLSATTSRNHSKSENVYSSFGQRVGDARRWNSARKIDIVTANLFSELLIGILRKLKRSNWLILSGVLLPKRKDSFAPCGATRSTSSKCVAAGNGSQF